MTIEKLLAAALRERTAFDFLREALTSNLVVANPYYLQISKFAAEFLDAHGTLPLSGDWEVWTGTLNEAQARGVNQSLGDLWAQDVSGYTPEYMASQGIEALREVAAYNALARLNSMSGKPNAETLQVLADEVSAIQPLSLEGLGRLEDISTWITPEPQEDAIPTGVERLDRMLGGFRKELVFLLADVGMGKTTALINFGMAAALHGANILHITMELSTKNTIHRYYRRIAEANRQQFNHSRDAVAGRVRHWMKYSKGSVAVMFVEPYTLDPDGLRRMLRLYTRMYGSIDMLILDYLDLMNGPREVRSSYERLGRVSHSVRGMCQQEFECTALSATQATRAGHGQERLRLSHMGDSYEKVRAADVIIALMQTEDEAAVHQARYGALKVREAPGRGIEVPLYINLDLMLLADLDSADARRIMAAHGHQLVQVGGNEDAVQDQPGTVS